MDDRSLIEDFTELYRTHSSFVYNVAFRMVESKEDAQEIMQDVFLKVHQKMNNFMFRSSIKTWMYRITVNCAINTLNKHKREHMGRVHNEHVFENTPSLNNTQENLDEKDREEEVNRLLRALNTDERACIILRNIEGLSYEEIAQSLNVNLNTVRTRLKRAREKMIAMQTKGVEQ